MQETSQHILHLVNKVATSVLEKGSKLSEKPTKLAEETFWGDTLGKATIILRCLNNAVLHDKVIVKLYKFVTLSVTVYGIPIPSNNSGCHFDFLVLDGNGIIANNITIPIEKTDEVKLWHSFGDDI